MLFDQSELVFAFFEETWRSKILIFGNLGAINGNRIAGKKLASFALARSEAGFDEGVDEFSGRGGREGLSEKLDI